MPPPGRKSVLGEGFLKLQPPRSPQLLTGRAHAALLRGCGLVPCFGAGLGWRIPLNYFQMGINAANPVCRRMDKQTKAPLDAINKPFGCCLWPGAENIPVLAWGTGTRCLAALPALWPRGRGASDSSGMVTAGIPSGAGVARV